MEETKVIAKLIEHDEKLENIGTEMQGVQQGINHLTEVTDKILHIVERLETEKTVSSHRLDEHDVRLSKLEEKLTTT